jgi:hypothetical protein
MIHHADNYSSLILIYVAFIIFLRDSIHLDSYFSKDIIGGELEDKIEPELNRNYDDSFEIVSKNKNVEVITAENYSPAYRHTKTTLKPHDFKEKFEEIANEKLPEEVGHDGQFTFVLEKMLTVIKESYNAYTAIFFWYNKRKKLSVENTSDSNDLVRRKFDLEDDILGKIIEKGEPELLSNISPAAEADVIRYYNSPQGIKSFVGVPLFFDKSLIAIIAVDSKVEDAFGIETIYALGRFVRVITMIISIFEEKHSESVTQQRLKGFLNLINPDKKFDNEENLVDSIQSAVSHLVHWDAFAFVYYHPFEQKFKTIKIVNNTSLKYIGQNLEIELNGTLTGKSIIYVPCKIDEPRLVNIKGSRSWKM